MTLNAVSGQLYYLAVLLVGSPPCTPRKLPN